MAQLTALIVSHDEEFKRQATQMLRSCGVPVGITEGRVKHRGRRSRSRRWWTSVSTCPRGSRRSSGSVPAIPRSRSFAVATAAEPDLILQAMRAGANEFFPWLAGGATPQARSMEESFHGAVRRTAARREAASAGNRQPCVTHVFIGAKGGAGHDHRLGELRGGARAPDEAADDHRGSQSVARRGRALPRRPSALHGARRDREPASSRQGLPEGARLEAQIGARHPRRIRAVRSAERPGRRRDRRASARPRAVSTTSW